MYTTESKIQEYLGVNISSYDDTILANWISAAEKYINNYTGKINGFEADTVASVRYYDGNGKRELDIDDFTDITSLEILEYNGTNSEYSLTEGIGNDYLVYPYNDYPRFRLILNPSSSPAVFPSAGDKRIKVTAKWGYNTTVPEDIQLAATMLVAGTLEKNLKGGNVQSESLGDYSVTFGKLEDSAQNLGVKKILDRYKIYTL